MTNILQRMPGRYAIAAALVAATIGLSGCGKKKSFDMGDDLGPAILGGDGAVRSAGAMSSSTSGSGGSGKSGTYVTVTKKRLKAKPTYNIVEVTRVISATDDKASWSIATLPFVPNGATNAYKLDRVFTYGTDTFYDSSTNTTNAVAKDGAWPFRFDYSYPQNNFQFKSAHLVVETMRDSSDTEGIFVDGVFSGRPPGGMVNTTTAAITDHVYTNVGGNTMGSGANSYYIDWSLAHYKRNQHNFFDLNFVDLLKGTTKTPLSVVKDGAVQAILGDDSPAYTAYLVVKGLTISSSDLVCRSSGPFQFRNTLVHNDGNSIGTSAFSGTIKPLYQAFSNPSGQTATEFYFDTMVPDTPVEKISLTTASLFLLKAKIAAGGCPIIVINGIGVSNPSCNRSAANTAVVESWDNTAGTSAAWTNFVAGLTTNSTGADATLDLAGLFGSQKVVALLKQGKFNVALAGTLVATSINGSNTLTAASGRTYGAYVDGPELVIDGTYSVDTCDVANNPDSPMTESGFIDPASQPPQYEDYQVLVDATSPDATTTGTNSSVTNDGTAPVIASLQVQDITSTGATILWTTDEPSTAQVKYGVTSTDTASGEVTTLSTFHKITLSGLSPYKYYKYQVISKDQYGNTSSSNIALFTTLR